MITIAHYWAFGIPIRRNDGCVPPSTMQFTIPPAIGLLQLICDASNRAKQQWATGKKHTCGRTE